MAATGIVGDYKGSQAREAMFTLEEWDAMKAQQAKDQESGMTV
jgi:S-DNA-T family DNA segregation ATPase FtsK/SpoIIIE